MEPSTAACQSCGRAPARRITVRHHVGLALLMQFHSKTVDACRPCGRALVRRETLRTLWMGWWGLISFFFNWFVLFANARAWRRVGALESPSLSGELVTHEPRGFDSPPAEEEQPKRRSRLRRGRAVLLLGVVALGLAGWGWDASHHDHEEAHAAPAAVPAIQLAMVGAFSSSDGGAVTVDHATCHGDGQPVNAGYTHFDCSLIFSDGSGDEVIVHLLENDELFFVSSAGGS